MRACVLAAASLDAQLWNAGVDRLGHAAELSISWMWPQAFFGEIRGQPLDIIEPPHGSMMRWCRSCCRKSWVLRAMRAEKSVGSARPRPAHWCAAIACALRRRHRLDAGAHDIVETSCAVSDQPRSGNGAQGRRAPTSARNPSDELRPDQAGGAQLGDFHEEVHADRPEERQARRELVDRQPGPNARAQIFDAVGERVGEFQILRRAGFLHVVAGDRDELNFGMCCEVKAKMSEMIRIEGCGG